MEQHPVPSQISAYEFRLVGDMTLKQFAQVAAGVIIALVFYASGLPFYLKWPGIIVSGVMGTLMAFVPLQERPLQTWILAFFKAVYSPTQFLWQKKAKTPEFLILKPAPAISRKEVPIGTAAAQQKLAEYLASLPSQPSPLDQQENQRLKQLGAYFTSAQLPPTFTPTIKPLPEKEMPAGLKVRRLFGPWVVEEERKTIGRTPLEPRPAIPQEEMLPQFTPKFVSPVQRPRERGPVAEAKFSQEISVPNTPTFPNLLVGMVLDSQGMILEGAIIEIRDQEANPVRALRTSKLGQFMIATPLADGVYEIETEKEGYQFDLIKITLTGKIVPPIEIRARRAQMENTNNG
jgi:hypothetical protein